MTHPTLSPELQTSLDELSAAITTLRAQHDRALETLNTMRVLLLCPMDAVLKVSSLRAALDLHDRPMEQPEPDNSPICEGCDRRISEDERRYETGDGKGEPYWEDYGCVYCLKGRNVKPIPQHGEPQSQSERDGDA